ncbi:MAG: hypothetical protein JWM33_3839 [Caulobacteraceae bacterium]|nr:hypothetical protein [Caulobacteraceae bacterium]
MVDRLLASLTVLTLAFSAASLLVIMLRAPCRRLAGSSFTYWLWLLVPLALIAALAPALPHPAAPAASLVIQSVGQPHAVGAVMVHPQAPSLIDVALQVGKGLAPYLIGAWSFGLLAFLCRIALMQRRFLDGLGRLTRDPGRPNVFYSEKSGVSPSVIGMLRSRIVLPADFTHLYATDEQTLIMAHERTHVRERHPTAGALGVLIVAAQWFNPLAYLALSLFRIDQELACDAAVVTAHPTARAAYAKAMLKARFAGAANPPLAYCWISRLSLPMKDRINLLKATPPTPRRRAAAVAMLTLIASGSAAAAYAVAPHAEIGFNSSPASVSVQPTMVSKPAAVAPPVKAKPAALTRPKVQVSSGPAIRPVKPSEIGVVPNLVSNVPAPPAEALDPNFAGLSERWQRIYLAMDEAAARGKNVAPPKIGTVVRDGVTHLSVEFGPTSRDPRNYDDVNRIIADNG